MIKSLSLTNNYTEVETKSTMSVTQAILALPKDQARVFVMKTMQKLSTETIAKELNISSKATWDLLHEARVSLMEYL